MSDIVSKFFEKEHKFHLFQLFCEQHGLLYERICFICKAHFFGHKIFLKGRFRFPSNLFCSYL